MYLLKESIFFFKIPGILLYGRKFAVFNVHAVLHLVMDAQLYGALDNSSAFLFENYLGVLKRKVNPGRLGLKQLVARLGEQDEEDGEKRRIGSVTQTRVSLKEPNNAFISDGSAIEALSETVVLGETVYNCRKYNRCDSFFDSPLDSKLFSCYMVDDGDTSIVQLKSNRLTHKAIKISMNQQTIFMGLLHNVTEHSA